MKTLPSPTSARLRFVRLMGSAVVSQALLSAASFAIGLLLIRRSDTLQYGSFVLAANGILLLVSLQNAFFGPALGIRMSRLDQDGRAALVGGLYAGQQRLLTALGIGLLLVAAALWALGWLGGQAALVVLAGILASVAILHREYLRMALLAHRRAHDVLRTDIGYAVLLVSGVFAATLTPWPAALAVATLGGAALFSSRCLAASLTRHEPWRHARSPGLMREIAPLAAWSTAGAAIHWSFSQGYVYLVAGTLDVQAVAALAATRLLLMPVNLLSSGISAMMLPLASGWLRDHGPAALLQRLAGFACGLALVTLAYFALVWGWRDAIFHGVLHKTFADGDALLLLWGGLFLVMVVRDQLAYALATQGRFRAMTQLTAVCALVSLSGSLLGMRHLGAPGALAGMLAGELLSLVGVGLLVGRQAVRPITAAA